MEEQNNNSSADEILIKDSAGGWQFLGQGQGQAVPAVKKTATHPPLVFTDEHLLVADRVAKELGLSWRDEILARRFKNIILASLKEIRTEVQTIDALTKGVEVGGLGLAEEQAYKIISWLKKNVKPKAVSQPRIKKLPPVSLAQAKSVPKKFQSPAKPVTEKKSLKRFSPDELDRELAPPPPALIKKSSASQKKPRGLEALVKERKPSVSPTVKKAISSKPAIPLAEKVSRSLPQLKKRPADSKEDQGRYLSRKVKPFIKQSPRVAKSTPKGFWSKLKARFIRKGDRLPSDAESSVKPSSDSSAPTAVPRHQKITDIRVPTRLTGPIDELRNFKAVDFRKLNSDPTKAALKIKEKIDLLASQSFSKYLEGIVAWQRSEVYRLYLSLGKESVEQGKPLEEIIEIRKKSSQPVLDKNEFLALGKLNKMLEY